MELKIDKSSWKKVKLGDVAFEYSKRINNPSESTFDRFIGSSNIGQWDFRVKSWESTDSVTSAMKLFEPNDYLLVRRSLYASDFRERAPRANFHGVCSGDILTIKENPDMVIDGFLIGLFNSVSLWNYIVANASGSITRRIKWKDLANYEFLLPPKSEQARLAELLWAMDEVIEREMQLENKLNVSKRAVFNELHKLRFNSYNLLEELCLKISSGGTPNRQKESEYFNGSIPWVKTKELNDWIVSETEEYLTDLGLKNSSAKLYPPNTILLAMYGVTVGKIGIIDKEMACNQACCAIIVDQRKIDNWFLFYYLTALRERLIALSVGSAQPNISSGLIKKLKIPSLNIDGQRSYTEKLLNIDYSIKNLSLKSQKTRALQKSLINQIF